MDVAAIKCVKCGSFQNWRRFMTMSSSMLALLIAFFSVLSVSLPVISDTVTPKNSKIEVRYRGPGGGISSRSRTFVFTVWNSGNRTGEIDKVSLTYDFGNADKTALRLFSTVEVLIPSAQLSRMPLRVVPGDVDLMDAAAVRDPAKTINCRIMVDGFDFLGKSETYTPEGGVRIDGAECREVLISYLPDAG